MSVVSKMLPQSFDLPGKTEQKLFTAWTQFFRLRCGYRFLGLVICRAKQKDGLEECGAVLVRTGDPGLRWHPTEQIFDNHNFVRVCKAFGGSC